MMTCSFLDEAGRFAGKVDRAARAVAKVENEGSAAIVAITNKGASGRSVRIDPDAGHVHTIGSEPIEIDVAEIVIADSRNHSAVMAELADLIDEDGGCAGGKRADEGDGGTETVAAFGGNDLDQDFADRQYLLHGYAHWS
jgi:hypothetical protein